MRMVVRLPVGSLRLLAPLVLLAGCATQVTLPSLPECHPAHPGAAAASIGQPSGLLEPGAPLPERDPMDGHEHHGHGMAGEAAADQPPEAATPHHEHEPQPPGEEQAPAGPDHGEDHAAHAAETVDEAPAPVYSCPMHPEVRFDSPGTCPVCGMALEEVESPAESVEDDFHHEHHPPGHGR